MARLGVSVAALLAAVISASLPDAGRAEPAPAQPAPGRPSAEELSTARRLFEEALLAEDAGRWDEALGLFLSIEKVAASPVVLFHVGLCHEHAGHWVEALDAFERAEQQAERTGKGDIAIEASAHIQEARKKTGRLVIKVPAGSRGLRLVVDGKAINAELAAAGLLVNPGDRRVVAHSDDPPAQTERTVTVAAGATELVEIDLRPAVKRAPAAPLTLLPAPAPEPQSLAPVLVAAGAAAALGAGAVATGLAAHDKHEDYIGENQAPAPGSLESRRALRDEGQTLALVSTLLTGGAVVAGGAAVILLLSRTRANEPRTPPKRATAITPWATGDGGGVLVRGAL